ncbi:MAG: hypothetical protein M3416_10750 [Acidobacteriota bacterium]|nr:hypothetical protein [Acidobacteriota bacterium]
MIPKRAERLPHRVLREGEATGHAHRAVEEDVTLHIAGGQLYMRVPGGGARVVHEEHRTQVIPPGDMAVGGCREMDHFEEEAREVVD